jgi:hypothetical protein
VSTVIIAALQSWHCLAFLYLGTYFAWLYLRFFQHQPETSIMGDPSEDFRFSSFFPAAMAAPIDGVAGVCGKAFRLKHDANAEAKPLLPTAATGTLLGSNAVDANRRRCVLCGSLLGGNVHDAVTAHVPAACCSLNRMLAVALLAFNLILCSSGTAA